MRQFVALLLGACATMVSAQEVLVECRFEFKPLGAKEMAKSKEKEAMAWFNDLDFSRRKFILNLATSEIVDGPGRPEVWKQPQVSLTPQDLEVEWQFHASPLDRSPRIWLRVSRFTGKATEGYSMLQFPNRGPRMVYWGRSGECTFSKRQI
jgi:hypothetical protein